MLPNRAPQKIAELSMFMDILRRLNQRLFLVGNQQFMTSSIRWKCGGDTPILHCLWTTLAWQVDTSNAIPNQIHYELSIIRLATPFQALSGTLNACANENSKSVDRVNYGLDHTTVVGHMGHLNTKIQLVFFSFFFICNGRSTLNSEVPSTA